MTACHSNIVVVTGSSGFIGESCCRCLELNGFHVIKAGRSKSDHVYCDLSLPDSVWNLKGLPAYNALIHLGAHVGWDGSSLQDMYVPNIVSTALIADITRNHNAHIIFASAAIIAGLGTEYISASSEIKPDTPYAKSKALAEQCLNASGVALSILRIGGVYGLHGPCHLGLNRMISAALDGDPPVVYGSGSSKRNYIYVEDLASVIVSTLQSRAIGSYYVSGHDILSIAEMSQLICQIFDLKSPPLYQAGGPSRSQIIKSLPDFTGKMSFAESLMSIKSLHMRLS